MSRKSLDDKQERRAEQLRDKFERQGMGQDEAGNRAPEEVAKEPSTGDSNERGRRNGSQSNETR